MNKELLNPTPVIVRYAPSPTGSIHVGNVRTALFCWIISQQTKGKFILRIEDTDKERSTKESENLIIKDLNWLGITWNEFYRQSERNNFYEEALNTLKEKKLVYACNCQRGKECVCEEECLPFSDEYAIRFKTPKEGACVFHDIISGEINVNWKEVENFVLCRKNKMYTFHLCVVVDDLLMGITNVIRGKDHLSNWPKYITLCNALGSPIPQCAHLPLVNGTDGSKLSKREGSASIENIRNLGIVSEAVLSCLIRLGWSHRNQEIFTVEEIIKFFNLDKVQKSAAIFDFQKLVHSSGKFLATMDDKDIINRILNLTKDIDIVKHNNVNSNYNTFLKAMPFLKTRSKTLLEIIEIGEFIYKTPNIYNIYDENVRKSLQEYVAQLKLLEDNSIYMLQEVAMDIIKRFSVSFKDFAIALREILTGKPFSPGVFEVIYIIGTAEASYRIERCL